MNRQTNLPSRAPWVICLAFASGLGLLFWLVIPAKNEHIWWSFLQWQGQTVGPMVCILCIYQIIKNYIRNPWAKLVLSGFIGSVICLPLAVVLDAWQDEQPGSYWSILLAEAAGFVPPVLISWIGINVPWLLGFQFKPKEFDITKQVTKDQLLSKGQPAFIKLLDKPLQGEIVCMKSELNYLKVTTVTGEMLILYNLKDAIDQLTAHPNWGKGLKIHRSYWVNLSFIEKFSRHGRQGTITLKNGMTIPVSRSYVATLQELLVALQ